MKIKIFTLLLMLFSAFSIFAEPIKNIRFATEASYPPFEYIDQSGQIKGFDIDLARALCEQLKAQCTFTNQSFNSLIPSLKLGKFDAIIAALGITKEREEQVDFTHPYYEPSASFVAPLSKRYTIASLVSKTIGVQQGTTFEKYLKEKYQNQSTLKSYASIQDAFLDLVSGRIDLVLADTPIAQEWLKREENSKNFGIVDHPIVDHNYFGSGYGIAVRKENNTLLQSLNDALSKIKKAGQYDTLMKKYFGH